MYDDFNVPERHFPASICLGAVNGFPSSPLLAIYMV